MHAARDRVAALYVRALVGRGAGAVPVRTAPAGVTRAFADALGLHLPLSFPMYGHDSLLAQRARLAAASHLAAHVRFGSRRMARGSLRPIQVVLVSLFEDARVEQLAARELPGLARLWRDYHTARPTDLATFPALCARLARALLDPSTDDPHPIVVKARALFFHPDHDLRTADGSRRLGSLLGNDVGQMRLSFNAKAYVVEPPYRDDHRLLWEEPLDDAQTSSRFDEADSVELASPREDPSDAAAVDGDQAHGGPPEAIGAARPAPAVEASPAADAPAGGGAACYPEWDQRIRAIRPDWSTVRERATSAAIAGTDGAAEAVDERGDDEAARREAMARVARLARRLRVETLVTRRREREGDFLDLDAAVGALVDRRIGASPDPRVYARAVRARRDVAVLLLLDLSASTGDPVRGDDGCFDGRVIDLERRAALLLGDVLARAGDTFAVHGFASNGRHEIDYHRLKDLDAPWDDVTRRRLRAIVPRLSTRMGAALRHAGHCLRNVRRDRRLVLLLTDGEPSDIDVFEPDYLVEDAKHAVATLRRGGIHVVAVSLDPAADAYVRRIFGPAGYRIVDRLDHLPEVLPASMPASFASRLLSRVVASPGGETVFVCESESVFEFVFEGEWR